MPYTAQTPIKGQGRGNPDKIKAWLRQRGVGRPDDADAYIDGLYAMAPDFGINADVCVCQFLKEASRREPPHEPGHGVPWLHGCNPVGIGVSSDAQWRVYDFANGRNGAMAHLMQLSIYVNGLDLPPGYRIEEPYEGAPNPAPRWHATVAATPSRIKCATVLRDLDGRWAVPGEGYGASIADRLNHLEAAGLFTMEDQAMTTYAKHQWPGLSNPVHLPDTLEASIKIIPSVTAGWTSGNPSNQHTTYTQHFTGNMNSSAQSEWNWAAGGGRAELDPPSPGSYQVIVDGNEVIVAQRFDEAAGHAANKIGNATSYACEMAIAGGYEAAFQNAAHVAAGVIVAKGWQVDTALVQHWNWLRSDGTQKNCPSIIRGKSDWSRYVATVTKNAAAIRTFLREEVPSTPPAGPVFEDPVIIPELDAVSKAEGIAPAYVDGGGARWFWVGDRVRVKNATGRFQRASKDAGQVGPDLQVGEEFEVDWITDFEGTVWFYTAWGTRIAADDVERISDGKGDAD
jgi:hypothetical protein